MKKIRILAVLALVAALIAYWWPDTAQDRVIRQVNPQTQRDTSTGPIIGADDADDTYAWLGIPTRHHRWTICDGGHRDLQRRGSKRVRQ